MTNLPARRPPLLASLAMTLAMCTSCLAGSCNALGGITDKLRDGQLFYRVTGASGWTEMPGAGTSLGATRSEFIYVVAESFEKERSGVVIIKTGRIRQAAEATADPQAKSLRLVRRFQQFDNSPCGDVPSFGKGAVSPKSYEDYHDVGTSTPDDATLDRFHFTYAARRHSCHKTNSSLGDSLSPYSRSNRGQFSFDTDVVDRGTYLQLALFLHVTTASASFEKLAGQRVETRQYRVGAGAPECISFRYSVPANGAFLRINDLEALSTDGVAAPLRSPEHRWLVSAP